MPMSSEVDVNWLRTYTYVFYAFAVAVAGCLIAGSMASSAVVAMVGFLGLVLPGAWASALLVGGALQARRFGAAARLDPEGLSLPGGARLSWIDIENCQVRLVGLPGQQSLTIHIWFREGKSFHGHWRAWFIGPWSGRVRLLHTGEDSVDATLWATNPEALEAKLQGVLPSGILVKSRSN